MRNLLHYLVGGLITYLLTFTYNGMNLTEQLLTTTIAVGIIGIFWEIIREMIGKSFFDWSDVIRGVIGGLIVNVIVFVLCF